MIVVVVEHTGTRRESILRRMATVKAKALRWELS